MLVSLLDHGAELEATDQWGQTAMHMAAQENAEESLSALIAVGATHQAVDMKGETPLHHAAREDSARAVEMLIQAGVNPNVLSRTGKMPLDVALPNGASRHILAMVTCHPDTREFCSSPCRQSDPVGEGEIVMLVSRTPHSRMTYSAHESDRYP